MRYLMRVIAILVFCQSLYVPFIYAASSPVFKDIRVTDSTEGMGINLIFDKPVKTKIKPLFYQKSIQIDLPAIIKVKKDIPIRNGLLRQVRVYPYKPGILRARLVLTDNAPNLRDLLSLKFTERGFKIHIKKRVDVTIKKDIPSATTEVDKRILLAIAAAGQVEERGEIGRVSEKDTEDQFADVLQEESLIPNSQPLALTEKKAAPVTSFINPQNRMPSLMKIGGWFTIVLSLIFFSAVGAKKVLAKNPGIFGNKDFIRVLASSQIGVKKNITLVDVAGDILVLGITNSNISMLAKLESESAINRIRSSQAPANKSVPIVSSLKELFKSDKKRGSFSKHLKKEVRKEPETVNKAELIASVAKSIREKF